eukprot:630159-Amphidinium_carterae.1
MAWYRYGSILLPANISVAEMRRECAFYQLPDDVKVLRDGLTVSDVAVAAANQEERLLEAAARLKAEALITGLLQCPSLGRLNRGPGVLEVTVPVSAFTEHLESCGAELRAAVDTVATREGLVCANVGTVMNGDKRGACTGVFKGRGKGYEESDYDSKGKGKGKGKAHKGKYGFHELPMGCWSLGLGGLDL